MSVLSKAALGGFTLRYSSELSHRALCFRLSTLAFSQQPTHPDVPSPSFEEETMGSRPSCTNLQISFPLNSCQHTMANTQRASRSLPCSPTHHLPRNAVGSAPANQAMFEKIYLNSQLSVVPVPSTKIRDRLRKPPNFATRSAGQITVPRDRPIELQ